MISDYLNERFNGSQPKKDLDIGIIRGIIEWFENIKTRPQMFFGEVNPDLVENGLYWFHMSFVHLGYNINPQENIIVERGLHKSAMGFARQLKERRKSDEEIVNELLDIEIAKWKQLLKEIEEDF